MMTRNRGNTEEFQSGAVMVTVGVIVFVLCLLTALGMETFRLLTGKIQMQNIAEYIAEVSLSEVRTGGAVSNAKIDSILASNYFLTQSESLVRSTGMVVNVGCFNPSTGVFTIVSSGVCVNPSDRQAVYVKLSTAGGRPVTKVLAQLAMSARIDTAASAISYWYTSAVGNYYVTGPFRGTISAS